MYCHHKVFLPPRATAALLNWRHLTLVPTPLNICFIYIAVGEVKLAEEGESDKPIEFNRLSEFHHDGRVEVIAWSPESSLLTFPKVC